MTPTPSHVATDELIETLERLEKEATPGPWKLFHDDDAPAVDYIERDMGDDRRAQGLEDPILHACLPRKGDLPLIVSLRNHLPALISALKENQRLREYVISSQHLLDWMNGNDLVADYADAFPEEFKRQCAALEAIRAALQPQRRCQAMSTDALIARMDAIGRGKITVRFIYPPIPQREFDWCATFDNDEPDDDGNMLAGYGRTQLDALNDLLDNAEAK